MSFISRKGVFGHVENKPVNNKVNTKKQSTKNKKGAFDDPGDLVLIVIMVVVAYLLLNLVVTESVKSAEQSSARALAAGNNMASDIVKVREMVQQEEIFLERGFSLQSLAGGKVIDLYESVKTYSFTAMGRSTWNGGREKSILASRYQGTVKVQEQLADVADVQPKENPGEES